MSETTTITEPEPWDDDAVLDWLEAQPGGSTQLRPAELGRLVGWSRQKVSRRLTAWVKDGQIVRRGRVITYNKARTRTRTIVKERVIREQVSALDARTNAASETPDKPRTKRRTNHVSALAQAAVNATRTNATHPIENEQKKLGQIQPDLPPAEPDKKADGTPRIPPLSPHSDTTSETASMGLFSRSKTPAEPPTEVSRDTPDTTPPAVSKPPTAARYNFDFATTPIAYDQKMDWHLPPKPKAGTGGKGPGFRSIARGMGWKTALLGVMLAMLAFALSVWTAHMAVGGLQVLFPGLGIDIVIGGWIIEAIKFVGSTYIVASWRFKPLLWCVIGGSLIFVAEVLNCGAIYNNLIAANLGETGARTTEYVTRDAGQGASIEAAQGRLADLDKRISQSDATITNLTNRGRTRDANTEKAKRAKLSADRDKFQTELSSLQAGRTTISARHQEVEAAAMPIKHTATLLKDIGWMLPSTGSERVLMWLAVLIVACCDPLAISMAILTASWLPIPRMRRQ